MAEELYAEIGQDGVVTRVIVADQNFINSGLVGDAANWVKTNYDTSLGVNTKGEIPLRKNYAGKGYVYDKAMDAFIVPKPFDSWNLNTATASYDAPKQAPKDGSSYIWDEKQQNWIKVNINQV